MKSGATESSFYYLYQYYNIPNNVEILRNAEELVKSSKPIKILWAHDNCDQPIHYRLPELSQHLSAIVCLSHWEKEQFIKYNRAPEEKLTIAYYGLDPIFIPPSQPKSKTAIFFSAPHKGITPLPKIWKQVLKNHPDAKLKVFSSMSLYENAGEYQEETQEFLEAIEELQSLPNVLYSPCIHREELVSHIQGAAFFVHPNVWEETFCLSLAEAMACGCFPIVSDIGALREVSFNRGKYIPMTGESTPTGWKPSPRFINEFAQELSRCFDFFDKEPETFYQATNDLSVLTRETYDWKKAAILWKEIILTLINNSKYYEN
jgi:glycosyltransferase involved in cell wall biosynthesis